MPRHDFPGSITLSFHIALHVFSCIITLPFHVKVQGMEHSHQEIKSKRYNKSALYRQDMSTR